MQSNPPCLPLKLGIFKHAHTYKHIRILRTTDFPFENGNIVIAKSHYWTELQVLVTVESMKL